MIVVDASAGVSALLNGGEARDRLSREPLAAPHLADSEVAHVLRSQVLRAQIDETVARTALHRWARLGIRRFGVVGLLPRIWELRDNVTAYDATYVALAEALGCELLTGDARLADAAGVSCVVAVVPR